MNAVLRGLLVVLVAAGVCGCKLPSLGISATYDDISVDAQYDALTRTWDAGVSYTQTEGEGETLVEHVRRLSLSGQAADED